MRSVCSALLACALLSACGQKGDLYFPEQEREVVTAPAASATTQAETEEQRRQRAPATNTAPTAPAAGAN